MTTNNVSSPMAPPVRAELPAKPDVVKVAAVQIKGYDKGEPRRADYDPTDSYLPYIKRAGNDGAQLVVFPEYVLGRIQVPGSQTKRIAASAKANNVYVMIGCWEVFADDSFANTILLFDRQGKIAGKYRKTHAAIDHWDPAGRPWQRPLAGKSKQWMIENDPEWIMKAGDRLPVFDLDFGKVGVLTCYDGWFPEPARVLSLKGAELVIWTNGRRGAVEDFIVKSTIFQSHVAMVTANQAYGAGTMIGDWPAKILARCPDREESYITASVNLKRIRQIRKNSRNFQQRRPDLYQTLVAPKKKETAEVDP